MVPFFQGFGIGAGLIIAIGAQNSFVLSQSVKRQYIFLIPLICALCDAVLIAAGAAGVGSYVASHPRLNSYAGVGGAVFLFWYGLKSLLSSLQGSSFSPAEAPRASRLSVILSTLAVSLLNPHVYLDTIIMLGAISGGFEGRSRFVFALGACCSSFVWFFTLSLGGTLLEPLFRKPLSWRILDLSMCLVMWSIACSIWPSPK